MAKKRKTPPRGKGGRFRKRKKGKKRKSNPAKKKRKYYGRKKKKGKRRKRNPKALAGLGPLGKVAAIVVGGIAAAEIAEYASERILETRPELADKSEWVGRAAMAAAVMAAGYAVKKLGVTSITARNAVYGIGAALVGREIVSELIERQRQPAPPAGEKIIETGLSTGVTEAEVGLEADVTEQEVGLGGLYEGQM